MACSRPPQFDLIEKLARLTGAPIPALIAGPLALLQRDLDTHLAISDLQRQLERCNQRQGTVGDEIDETQWELDKARRELDQLNVHCLRLEDRLRALARANSDLDDEMGDLSARLARELMRSTPPPANPAPQVIPPAPQVIPSAPPVRPVDRSVLTNELTNCEESIHDVLISSQTSDRRDVDKVLRDLRTERNRLRALIEEIDQAPSGSQ
ncbi:MAG: hypothetical protein EBQ92_04010 [Proteobacteria bacterium]|nr:hypothetical protein [Pseudomonadota bacterium]